MTIQCQPMEPLFELDLTAAQLPERLQAVQFPRRIVCELSRWECDLDVVGPEVNDRLRAVASNPGNQHMPVGFRLISLPVGAVLRRIR